MLLMDDTGALRMAAHVGWPSELHERISAIVLDTEESPLIFASRRGEPETTTLYDHTTEDPMIRGFLERGGMDLMAVVGIALPDRMYGVLVAGFVGQAAAGVQSYVARMLGVADQAATVLRTCELLDETWRLAHLDALTGLPNRRAFMTHLAEAVRTGPGAVLFIDLDGFKGINDSLGHAAGDDLLAAVAGRLQGCTRAGDLVARLGGDEFVILSPALETETDLRRLTQRVREAFREPVAIAGVAVAVRLSVDGTLYAAGETSHDVLNRADSAMYRAKRARRSDTEYPKAG
ncbi:GGDEF domain-containing protein [Planosporangium mesophilum]|nr:GGDEF domain-containing protein [Planosporangium mesophilum]